MSSSTVSSANETDQQEVGRQNEANQQKTRSNIPNYIVVATASVSFTTELMRIGVLAPRSVAGALGYAMGSTLIPALLAYFYHRRPNKTRFWTAVIVSCFFLLAALQPY